MIQVLRLFQHTFGTHPEQPVPTGCKGNPFIVGYGDCLGCAPGVCCNFLGQVIPTKTNMTIRKIHHFEECTPLKFEHSWPKLMGLEKVDSEKKHLAMFGIHV